MNQIEKICAEIEMRIKEGKDGYGGNLKSLLSFIESLEKEQEVNLDFQRFSKEMDAVFALPAAQTKNTEDEPLNWEYAIAKHFYELGCRKKDNAPKIKGWVARDKGAKSCCFYFNKPIRHTISWMDERGETGVYNDVYVFLSDLHLDIEDLKWEDEPIEVELMLKRI